MDLFNRRRVAELEKANKNLNRRLQKWENDELSLMSKIRDMDQLIFSMSQCSSWDQMRPIFAKLKTFTDERMIDESNRIRQVLIPEMQKVYRSNPRTGDAQLVYKGKT